jgi:hypothetical protein
MFVMIAGTSNGVNLTDGLDGLATGRCDDGVRRVHAGVHLAVQPELCTAPARSATRYVTRTTSRVVARR